MADGRFPTVPELVDSHGVKVADRCSCCGRKSLYKVGVFYACSHCDAPRGPQYGS